MADLSDLGHPKLSPLVKAVPGHDPALFRVTTPRGEEITLHASDWRMALWMDGTRTIEQLTALGITQGFPSSVEEMQHLIQQLDSYGLLETPPPAPAQAQVPWLVAQEEDVAPAVSAPSVSVSSASVSEPPAVTVPPSDPLSIVVNPEEVPASTVLVELSPPAPPPSTAPSPPASPSPASPPPPATAGLSTDWMPPPSLRSPEVAPAPPAPPTYAPPTYAPPTYAPPAYAPARHRPQRSRRWFSMAVVFAALTGLLAVVRIPLRQPFQLKSLHSYPLVASSEGMTLTEWVKQPGEKVKRGELLAKLGGQSTTAAITQLTAELEAKRQEAAQAKKAPPAAKSPTGADPAELRKTLAAKRKKAYALSLKVKKLRDAIAAGEGSEEALEEAQAELDMRRKEVSVTQGELAAPGKPAPAAPPASASEADIKALETKLAALQAQADSEGLRAPSDGIWVAPELASLLEIPLHKGDSLGQIIQTDRLRLEVYASETSVDAFVPGQKMRIRVYAVPDGTFEGTIGKPSSTATWIPHLGKHAFVVSGEVKNIDGLLKDGMTGYVELVQEPISLLDLFWRKLTHWVDRLLMP